MNINIDSSGLCTIEASNKDEVKEIKDLKAQAVALLPNLRKLWDEDIVVASELHEISQFDGGTLKFSHMISEYNGECPVFFRKKGGHGRPMSERTTLATFRFLLFAPFKLVLAREKEWRINEYVKNVRDKSVKRVMVDAKKRAVRDADMCVKRAHDSVEKWFIQREDRLIRYAILRAVVEESMQNT